LYQLLTHALSDPTNHTKFTLIYANTSPSDILLCKELDALKQKHPNTLNIVYLVDKPVKGWTGPTGYIDKQILQEHVGPKELGEKVKIFVCGELPCFP